MIKASRILALVIEAGPYIPTNVSLCSGSHPRDNQILYKPLCCALKLRIVADMFPTCVEDALAHTGRRPTCTGVLIAVALG
jgi:hypothetical protein